MTRLHTILVTDYAWPSLTPEEAILLEAGAALRVAATGDESELLALAPQATGILTNWRRVSRRVLEAAPRCVSVGRYGIGLDNIDVEAATELGIVVTNVPSYCVEDVADHAMALLLACVRKIAWFDRDMKAGMYDLARHTPLHRLAGRTLGILGYGRIGRALALRARAFGMTVITTNRRAQPHDADGVEAVPLAALLERSDYVSIHLPSAPGTRGLLDAAAFAALKPGAILVNTARGDLVHAGALLEALDTGRVAAAGLDVWTVEPVPSGDALALHPRVVATPHAAFNTVESIADLQRMAASQMAAAIRGATPDNTVNPIVLDSAARRTRVAALASRSSGRRMERS